MCSIRPYPLGLQPLDHLMMFLLPDLFFVKTFMEKKMKKNKEPLVNETFNKMKKIIDDVDCGKVIIMNGALYAFEKGMPDAVRLFMIHYGNGVFVICFACWLFPPFVANIMEELSKFDNLAVGESFYDAADGKVFWGQECREPYLLAMKNALDKVDLNKEFPFPIENGGNELLN